MDQIIFRLPPNKKREFKATVSSIGKSMNEVLTEFVLRFISDKNKEVA